MLLIIISAIVFVFLYFLVGFIIAQKLNDNSIADIMWGGGFVGMTIVFIALRRLYGDIDMTLMHVFTFLFFAMWGARLLYYIFKRNRKSGEDYRYQNMRKKWGKNVRINAFFKVFMTQGVFMLIVALPIIMIYAYPKTTLSTYENLGLFIGSMLFLFGFIFEAISDQQLRNFKHRPEMKGRILKTGLWRFSRHPNYFGEATLWWGLGLIALSNTQVPYNYIALIGPLVITILVRFISGVPLLEAEMQKKEEFRDYAKKTSIFFPLPPKKIK